MPKIYPFKALRPKAGWENRITAKSTDFETHEELVEEVNWNLYSSHWLTKSNLVAEFELFAKTKSHQLGAAYLKRMKGHGYLLKDESDSFYLYKQDTASGNTFVGIMALCNLDDYDKHLIKRHEETQPIREKHMANLFEVTGVMGEGVLLAHEYKDEIKEIYADIQKVKPNSDFVSVDGKRHRLWVISEYQLVVKLSDLFANIPEFYIADGHHRFASALRLSHKKKEERYHFCSTILIDETQLNIFPFHRWYNDPESSNPPDIENILETLSSQFKVYPILEKFYEPKEKGSFGMYIKGHWFKLVLKPQAETNHDVLSNLDVSILERLILKPLFGIVNSKTDHRLSYKSANSRMTEFTEKIDDGTYQVGFTLFHVTFEEVKKIADAELTMPPKSTYIEPKLRNGMVIMEY